MTLGMLILTLSPIKAPYGKFQDSLEKNGINWNLKVDGRLAFVIFEFPNIFIPIYLIWFYWSAHIDFYSKTATFLFYIHYVHRTFIFPLLRMKKASPSSLVPIIFGIKFTVLNSYLITKYNVFYSPELQNPVLFISGILLFLVGFIMNIHSDHILLNLRKPGETCYKIPDRGMFRYVTSANYLGEILEWTGYSIAFCSPATLLFVFTSCCNLVPRAMSTYDWYVKKFGPEKFENKKCILPLVF